MEGFVRLRLRPWVRRLVTRLLAIVPALLVIGSAQSHVADRPEEADELLMALLILSQAILSFQLPFAIVPLVQFTGDRQRMGHFASGLALKALAWLCAAVVVGLNVMLIYLQTGEWAGGVAGRGGHPGWIYGTVGPIGVLLLGFLGWVMVYPLWARREERAAPAPLPELAGIRYRTIGAAVELEGADEAVLAQAAALARAHAARLVAVHVVEGTGAALYGPQTDDQESRSDRQRLGELVEHLRSDGLEAAGVLGFGNPPEELVRIAREETLDLLVVGTHGHRLLADLALGATVSPVLHRLTIPVLVVPNRPKA